MTSIITPSALSTFATNLADEQISHDVCRTLAVKVDAQQKPQGDAFTLGCRFHAELASLASGDERKAVKNSRFAPWLNVIRDELKLLGATNIAAEVAFGTGIGSSRADLIVYGDRLTIVEVKTGEGLPGHPLDAHCMQLAGLSEMCACKHPGIPSSSVLVYVSFKECEVRFFVYRDNTWLRLAVKSLLAA